MLNFLKFLAGLSFIGSIAWFYSQRDYEPALAIIGSLSTFIGLWVADTKTKRKATQHQVVAQGGIGIQAGGDIQTGDIRINK